MVADGGDRNASNHDSDAASSGPLGSAQSVPFGTAQNITAGSSTMYSNNPHSGRGTADVSAATMVKARVGSSVVDATEEAQATVATVTTTHLSEKRAEGSLVEEQFNAALRVRNSLEDGNGEQAEDSG